MAEIGEMASPEGQVITASRVDEEFARLAKRTGDEGLAAALADAIGTVMGVAHFLKTLGMHEVAKNIWLDAKTYTKKS